MKFVLIIFAFLLTSCQFRETPDRITEEKIKQEYEEKIESVPPSSGFEEQYTAPPPPPAPVIVPPAMLYDYVLLEPNTNDVLDQLEAAVMAFNIPNTADINETIFAELEVGFEMDQNEIIEHLDSTQGHLIIEDITVSKILTAELISANFNVVPLTARSQALSNKETTEWRWTLQPLDYGTHLVTLVVHAHVKVGDKETTRTIEVHNEVLEITVTAKHLIFTWLEKHWEWLFTALIFPLVAWTWNNRKRKKKSSGRR